MHQINTLYTLDLHNVICQLHLSKSGKLNKKTKTTLTFDQTSIFNFINKIHVHLYLICIYLKSFSRCVEHTYFSVFNHCLLGSVTE